MLNPLPILYKPSRWWLVKNVSRLLTSGAHRVEVCLLIYLLSFLIIEFVYTISNTLHSFSQIVYGFLDGVSTTPYHTSQPEQAINPNTDYS